MRMSFYVAIVEIGMCLVLAAGGSSLPCPAAEEPAGPDAPTAKRQENLLPNGDFSNGLTGWELRPGTKRMVEVREVPGIPGRAVHLTARGTLLGLNSPALEIGRDLRTDRVYTVSARVRFDGVKKGIAALSVCFYDRKGKRIRQVGLTHWSVKSKPHAWKVRSILVGPGAAVPFEPEAAAMRVRLSFYSRDGRCEGDVWLADVRVTPARRGPYAHWPASILVDCGDIQTRFESRSFWTLYRIDYKGKRLGLDRFGSHYGSVVNFPGVGFVGSGHTENGETEHVELLELTLDGRNLDTPPPHVTGRKVTLHKVSKIRQIRLDTLVTVLPDRIHEKVTLSVPRPVRVKLIYHFMHPWTTNMNRWLARKLDGRMIEGVFVGDGRMKVDAPVRWSAVYSDAMNMGAVTCVLQAPDDVKVSPWKVWYWDKKNVYRKHYFVTFQNKVIPPHRIFQYHIVTIPFESTPDAWTRTARTLADLTPLTP